MKPVLIEFAGLQLQSYGASKAVAALVAGWLIKRELMRRGRDPESAFGLTLAAVVGGFAGAKLYYLAEMGGDGISMHELGPTGFTWFGGLVGGAAAMLLVARRYGLAPGLTAGITAIPLAVGYGIGRLGCLLAGDGTYGTPTDLPWAMSFPDGTMPTTELVHPAPLYEALAAFAIALVLWRLRDRLSPAGLFGALAVLMGGARLLVEFVRLNEAVALGLTAPQLWSLALMALGAALLIGERSRLGRGSRQQALTDGATP